MEFLFDGLPLWALLIIMTVVSTAGAFIQRVTGFGFAIFSMIFLAALLPSYGEANLIAGMLSMCSTFFVAVKNRKYIRHKKLIIPLIANFIVMIPAVLLMKKFSSGSGFVMKILLGSILLLLSIWFLFVAKRVSVKEGPVTGAICGGAAGAMAGLFSMGGPPIVFYMLETSKENKLIYIATVQSFFFVQNLYGTIVKSANGFMTKDVLIYACAGLVGMLAGTLIGSKVYDKLSAAKLRIAVYGFMGISGISNIIMAIVNK